MHFRLARHTGNLDTIIDFYHGILGLEILGEFKDHDNYNGIFLGFKNSNWHLEFTCSPELPNHEPDDDDLLVFYVNSVNEFSEKVETFKNKGINEVSPKNSYWKANGATFVDPDGFRVVISILKGK